MGRQPGRLASVLPDPKALRLQRLSADGDRLLLIVASRAAVAVCPRCRGPSGSVHSRYQRTLRDLPWHGFGVRLRLTVRRFRCRTSSCRRKIFVERLPAVAGTHSRQTARCAETLRLIGYALGGEAGARLAARLGLEASPDTLLRRLQTAPTAPPTARVIGVDDWAWRKGQRYGTIIVDLERGGVIGLLADRSVASFQCWLEQHPQVELVSRDRAGVYAEACRRGAPAAVQVADRFHLILNLTAAIERVLLARSRQLRYTVYPAEGESSSTKASRPRPPTAVQQRQQQRRDRRVERYEQVVALHRHGFSQQSIAGKLGIDRKTVRRWLLAGSYPERQRAQRSSRLTPFYPHLEQRWREGCRNGTQLWREIQSQGYAGARGMVAQLVAQWRREGVAGAPKRLASTRTRTFSPRRVAALIARRAESLQAADERSLRLLSTSCPALAALRALAAGFRTALESGQPRLLQVWMRDARQAGFAAIDRFVQGLQRDWPAVAAAVSYRWSNGPVEGQINRLKLIKRQMYGRAGFQLLRSRVLPYQSAFTPSIPARAP